MSAKNDSFKDRLARYSEITISVKGRKTGRVSSRPVWFVFENDTIYLLPVQGTETQWYKNVLENKKIGIDARGEKTDLQAVPTTDSAQVESVVEKFRSKYGARDVKKYYSKFDAAVTVNV